MPRPKQVPSYRLHKQSGQAVVTLPDGLCGRRDVMLGKYGSPESRVEYARVLAEWETNGRRLPPSATSPDLTVNELLLQYWRWAESHYLDADGNPSRELESIKDSLRGVRRLYGQTQAAAFGPLALRSVQEDMAKAGLARSVVNDRVNRVRRVFKWAVSFQLIPSTVFEALRTVPGLKSGRSEARETAPILPVPEERVKSTLPFLPAPVRAVVELQLLTGMRPSEVMIMRAIDLTMHGETWIYRPASHKNRHRGFDRVIFLGPLAQNIIKPFLTTNLEAYLFSPCAYVESMHARRAAARVTKRTPSEDRRRRKSKPKRTPGERYTRGSYRMAVVRACEKANVLPWTPLQLRHTAATRIRAQYGLEASKAILGHARVETSQIYAERDMRRAEEIMKEIG
jgi:integrase